MEKLSQKALISIMFFFNEKRCLKSIKYNKKIQKLIEIDLSFYKNYSGKYIIYDYPEMEKGREFNNNRILIYIGGYKSGERSGQGKEYDNGELIFHGKYENGQRNGEGAEYKNERMIFKGEYENGQRNGPGVEYEYEKIVFEGIYLNGKRNGAGKEFIHNPKKEQIFSGEYKNGERWEGEGEEYDSLKNIIFEGLYKYGKRWNGRYYEYDEEGFLLNIANKILYKNNIIKKYL